MAEMSFGGKKIKIEDMFYAALALAAVCVAIYVRLRLAGVPLDRDEGEFAYAGQLALQGVPPYLLAYNMKFPGIYWVYALIMSVFGQSDYGIRTGFLVINFLTAFLVYSTGKRLMDNKAALTASACFLIIMLSKSMHAVYSNAENVVILFSFAGLRLLVHAADTGQKRWVALGGLLLGLSVVVRQHGVFFLAAGFLYIIYANRKIFKMQIAAKCGLLAAGAALPVVAVFVYIYLAGVSATFFFWVFKYGMKYVNAVDIKSALGLFVYSSSAIFSYCFPILLFALAGLIISLSVKRMRETGGLLLSLFAFSFAATSVGFYFRSHYFIYIMPVAALMCGAAVYFFENLELRPLTRLLARVLLIILIAAPVFISFNLNFRLTTEEAARASYYDNPFVDMKKIALYIKKNTISGDTVTVLGSEPQVYFYSGRYSASGYIYMYPLMELHEYAGGMQEQAINQIEKAKPKFITVVNYQFSWLVSKKSDMYIFKWFDGYWEKAYKIVCVADMTGPDSTEYRWGTDIKGVDYKKPFRITVFKRVN